MGFVFVPVAVCLFFLFFFESSNNTKGHVNWVKSHQGKKCLGLAELFARRLETGEDKRGDTSEGALATLIREEDQGEEKREIMTGRRGRPAHFES